METQPIFPSYVAVLTAVSCNTVKTYLINDEGQLECLNYGHEKYFNYKLVQVQGIEQFVSVLTALSKQKNAILIRGLPVRGLPKPERRIDKFYPEPETGSYWVMIDFDNLPAKEGMNPHSREALEFLIQKLPREFHDASYFYQFSSSAGILKTDGTPLKPGINAHVFFWFQRPVMGKELSAYLESYCFDTGFYSKTFDRGDAPIIKPGVDLSVIRSSVQPHYIGLPIIHPGVKCVLPTESRQGFVQKKAQAVTLPVFAETLINDNLIKRKSFLNAWKMECGWVAAKITTRATNGGISVSAYHRNPNGPSPSTGRVFMNAEPYGDDAVILYFEGESSPGSFFVKKFSPQLAIRFGDYNSVPLKELSDGAYIYVRDELKWFSEIAEFELQLTDAGYLPDIQSFSSARNTLIVASTGSGKTEAFCRYALSRKTTILYAAQTIALVDQMYDKLRTFGRTYDEMGLPIKHGVQVTRYTDYRKGDFLRSGEVYVTTNESLPKFIEAAMKQGESYDLVIDEIHVALDDFMVNERKNRYLEQAIGRAERSIFMTGTITNLQVSKLLDTVSRACGALTPTVYTGYHFQPVKRNPLCLANVSDFGTDFIALLRHYQALKNDSKPIPRTVAITPTTKMRVYEQLLEHFGLLDDACVVSRQESFQEEIEVARTSRLPILISSPVFALGLNFEVEPERFWTFFSHLQVDESQIIQTLNRANRGNVPCEVRLYVGELDPKPVMIPKADMERLKIQDYLIEESTIQGMLDAHFHIDRVTFQTLRDVEKKTAKSLYNLIEGDRFQNYHIQRQWEDTLAEFKEEDDKEFFKDFKKAAADSYDHDVAQHGIRYESEPVSLQLYQLEKLYERKRDFGDKVDQVPRGIENEELGVCMAICNVTAKDSVSVKPARIRRLFGEIMPYMTAQYSQERAADWKAVAIEKTLALIPLLQVLKKMSNGELHGHAFAALMRRPSLRGGVRALADNERDYIHWQKQLARLDEISNKLRNRASEKQKPGLKREQFEIAEGFLKTIGVFFETVLVNDKKCVDPSQPIVPPWDFDIMIQVLSRKAESLKRIPDERIGMIQEDLLWAGANVARRLCASCVHCNLDFICALGHPIQPHWDDIEATTEECDSYRKISVKLNAWQPTKI